MSVWHVVWWGRKYHSRKLDVYYLRFEYVFFPVIALLKKVHDDPKNEESAPFKSKMLHYRMIDHNDYLGVFTGAKKSDKLCMMDLTEILFSVMPNIWNKQ